MAHIILNRALFEIRFDWSIPYKERQNELLAIHVFRMGVIKRKHKEIDIKITIDLFHEELDRARKFYLEKDLIQRIYFN